MKKKKKRLHSLGVIGSRFYLCFKYGIIIRKILLSYCLKLRKKEVYR